MTWLRMLLVVVAVGAGDEAQASVHDWLEQLGTTMAPYLHQASGREAPRQLDINGTKLWFAVGQTADAPAEVRRWYAAEWRAPRYGYDLLRDTLAKAGVLPDDVSHLNQLVFGDDDQGGMAALDFGEPLTGDGLQRRLARFLETGQLGELAQLRFLHYQRAPGGGTQYFTLWTDHGFDLDRLLPPPGRDVDGGDLDGVPRLPRVVRVLAVGERGRPERLRVYRGPGSVVTACRFYRDRLRAGGWSEDTDFARFADEQGHTGLHFRRHGRELFVDLSPLDDELTINLIELN
jgi:hypothetical protein